MSFVNLHRHSCYSLFDGGATPKQAALYASNLGQKALGLTDHGVTGGLIEHFAACREAGVKPVLGVEAYFQPKFDKTRKRFHLTVLVENDEGYFNMNKMLSAANRDKFYRTANVDLELLRQYNKGLIVLSGCLAGTIPRLIAANKTDKAERLIGKFLKIFGDRFYLEVQPYLVGEQQQVNEFLLEYGAKQDVPAVMTVDSHYCNKADYDTYQLMYQMSGKDMPTDYSQRYMPSEKQVGAAWKAEMKCSPLPYLATTQEIADRCNVALDFKDMIPKLIWDVPSRKKLTNIAVDGLKATGCWNAEYKERLKYELGIVLSKGFEDYFLLVHDIVNFARRTGIAIGFGRGSVCGSLLAYAIGITNVDPVRLDIRFEKFLHSDKNSLPDIDIDFDSRRRQEVVAYILQKYEGRSAPIATFGYYKVKNLVNDLAKVYNVEPNDVDTLKTTLNEYEDVDEVAFDDLMDKAPLRKLNVQYDGIVKHFAHLFGQVRFIGRHAAGVAITNDDIDKYMVLQTVRGAQQTSYDMENLDRLKVLKIDVLGLEAVSMLNEIEQITGEKFTYDKLEDKKVYKRFAKGETVGIFHFEKTGAIELLHKVQPINIQELTACIALNRPAPLKLGIVDDFVRGKNGEVDATTQWYQHTKDTYGAIVYQEHVMGLCRNLAQMQWKDVDYILKLLKKPGQIEKHPEVKQGFVDGAVKHSGLKKQDAEDLFDKMTLYLFNKAHGVAYSITAYWAMWLKTYHPLEFWFAVLKHEKDVYKRSAYKAAAVRDGVLIWLPHVNGSAEDTLESIDGDRVIREGLSSIKGVGMKSAQAIKDAGPYMSEEDMLTKVPKRSANSRVVEILRQSGALEFDETKFLKRVEKYNASMYASRAKIR